MSTATGNEAYNIIVVKFDGKDRAKQVVDLAKKQQKAGDYKVKAWAVIEVDEKGKTEVKQMGHGGVGAGVGAGTGVVLSLLGGPAGLLAWALGGAVVGGLLGKYGAHKFDSTQLKAVGATMENNTSGIIMVLEDTMMESVANDMGATGGTIVTVTLGDQLSGEVATLTAIDLGEAGEAAPDEAADGAVEEAPAA